MIKLANHSRISFVDSLLVVAQKDKNRVCVDFRGLNKAVLADNYPLRRIDDLLSHFGPTPEEQIAYSQGPCITHLPCFTKREQSYSPSIPRGNCAAF